MPDLTPQIQPMSHAYAQKLDELHDDYVHSRGLWNDLLVRVQYHNENPIIHNPTTGTVTTGMELVQKARPSLERLRNRSFKDIVAQFELFTAELLNVWLHSYTALIKKKAIDVQTLLNSHTLADAQSAAVNDAVQSTIAEKMYGKPEGWLTYLRTNLGVHVTANDSSTFVEMKARRDALEHNNGIIEATYMEKSKAAAVYQIGDAVQILDRDVDEAYRLVRQLIQRTSADAIATSAVS